MTDMTSCIRHRANAQFMLIHDDILRICEAQQTDARQSKYKVSIYAKAAAIRVLEVMTNRRRDTAPSLEDKDIDTAELEALDIWITMRYEDFHRWSLGLYSESSFARALIELEEDGFVESRCLIVENDKATWVPCAQATASSALKMKQYRLVVRKVQEAIDELSGNGGPSPSPPGRRRRDPLTEEEVVGNNEAASPETTNHTGALPQARAHRGGNLGQGRPYSQNTPQLGKLLASGKTTSTSRPQPCATDVKLRAGAGKTTSTARKTTSSSSENYQQPAGKTTSNRESDSPSITQESLQKEGESAPGGASSFLFDHQSEICSPLPLEEPLIPETIIALAKAILGLIPPEDLETAYHSAERLLTQTSGLEAYDARYRIEADMHYMTDEGSPSWWVAGRAVRTPVKLWHVADYFATQWLDLVGHHWQSASMPGWFAYQQAVIEAEAAQMAAVEAEFTEVAQVMPQPKEVHTDELAPPVEVAQAEQPEEPPGMTTEEASALMEQIDAEAPPSIKFGWRQSTGGGFVVRVGVSEGQEVWLYAPDEWPALRETLEEKERQWKNRWEALRAQLARSAPPSRRERRAVA